MHNHPKGKAKERGTGNKSDGFPKETFMLNDNQPSNSGKDRKTVYFKK